MLYKKAISSLVDKSSLKGKLTGFQTAFIMKLALLEAPSLLGMMAFFLTENLFYLIFVGVLMIYFFLERPTKARIINDLELNESLKDQFNEQDKIIL